MGRVYLAILFLCFIPAIFFTQNYTWKDGNTLINQAGSYNQKGIISPSNHPGAREGAVTWRDKLGKLWLFGGEGYDETGTFGFLNDLWCFDLQTEDWTWIHGSRYCNKGGIYGINGSSDTSNVPGSRKNAVSWADSSGQLWLFGGFGHDTVFQGWLNDLWKFDIQSSSWTWVDGNNGVNATGVYGNKGVSGVSSAPGGRESATAFEGSNGELLLFGGINNNQNYFNDLWKFNTFTLQWTWLSGDSITNAYGIYTQPGVPNSSDQPGARYSSTAWRDTINNLWLYGGFGFVSSGSPGYLSDLWKYNLSSNKWAWMKGQNTINQSSINGSLGTSSPLNNPGGVRLRSAGWKDSAENLLLFGGGDTTLLGIYTYNDLWKFEPASNNWTWMKGGPLPNQNGIYGSLGSTQPNNNPGSRKNSAYWTSNTGDFWLCGGFGFPAAGNSGYLNDLWKLTVNPVSVGISETHSTHNICNVYPNPAQGSFVIDVPKLKEATVLSLINALGQEVYLQNLLTEKTLISPALEKGVYFYRVYSKNQAIGSGKLIID